MTNPTYETPFATALAEWEQADKAARDYKAELDRQEAEWDAANPGPAPLAILNLEAHNSPTRNGVVFTRPALELSSDPADVAKGLPTFTAASAMCFWADAVAPVLVLDGMVHSARYPRGPNEPKPTPPFIAEIIAHHEAKKAALPAEDEEALNRLWCEEWDARQTLLATPAATPADLALKLDVFTLQAVDGFDWPDVEATLASVFADVARFLGATPPSPALAKLRGETPIAPPAPVDRAA